MTKENQSGSVKRKKIGLIDPDPKQSGLAIEKLTPHQQALREAVINHFKTVQVQAYIAKQIEFVNSNKQVGDTIRFLFDEHGRPPANAPLEEIIEERKKIEAQIKWLEALCFELKANLVKIKEIEERALDLLDINQKG